ncbi:DNA polymerase IV [Arthrobacter rhombi]|uniref:DNA polymerase IV n=1 Tax=Arthrobacter rhombi TaxID=71253 RepID=UPI003FD01873
MVEAPTPRTVFHVDMDAFYVSVELLTRPELKGHQVIVGNPGGRSVVLSASYECRRLGVRSAMPMSTAMRLAPKATIIEPSMASYRLFSERIMSVFSDITPLVEQVSVDEAFLDVTGSLRRLGEPLEIGRMIRARFRDELGLPASVGIARNKYVAKVASTRAKPDGLLRITPEDTVAYLHTLPVEALWGVGAKTGEVLARAGISLVSELAQTPLATLERLLGSNGLHLHALAWGRDDRAVEPVRVEKSIGAEETFAVDVHEDAPLKRELLRLAYRVAQRLRHASRQGQTVALKLRYSDFTTMTRSRRLAQPTNSAQALLAAAEGLLAGIGPRPQAVRLIGIRVEQLSDADGGIQLSFERSDGNWRQAEETMDRIRQRFPAGSLQPATLMPPPESSAEAET